MSEYYCMVSKGKPNYPNFRIGGTHLEVVTIVENPTVTDEFPNGAQLGNIMKTIRLQREERNTFWEEKNKQRWVKEEARP